MCPFCYIGKRKFEKALEQFPARDQIEVIWKSFQLDPSTVTDPSLNTVEHLAAKKGWSKEEAEQATAHVSGIARQVGLDFHFDKAVVANSFDAHRLSHLALKHGKQNDLEEKLFAAYFTEGKNTADADTLIQIGAEAGLNPEEVASLLAGNQFATEVQQDITQAQQLGVRGVPFFVLDRKYAVSGAQEADTFLQALTRAYDEHQREQPLMPVAGESNADTCGPDGCAI